MDELRYIKELLKELEMLKGQQMVHSKFLQIIKNMIKELDRILEVTKNTEYARISANLRNSVNIIAKIETRENSYKTTAKDYEKTVENTYENIKSLINQIT